MILVFSFFQISASCSLSEEIEVKIFIESRDERGDLAPQAKIIVNGVEKGITDGNGLFGGAIKAAIGRDVILNAIKGDKMWETSFKVYPKIGNFRIRKKDGFEGDIRLEDEVLAIAKDHQKGEYRFIAILTKNN